MTQLMLTVFLYKLEHATFALHHSFTQRPVHLSRVEIWVDGYKKEGAKKFSKTIGIVSYALKVSVNGVMCICSPFQVIRHISKFVNWLNS